MSDSMVAMPLRPIVANATEPVQPIIRLRNIGKRYGDFAALKPVDLDIFRGDFFALLGPSGCGKTTLLRLIGGFLSPSSGSIELDGRDVTTLPPEARRTSMVFQGYGLFPHMTVRQNIGYGLRIAKYPRDEIEARVERMLKLVHLTGFEDRLPNALSGGQQQRVALARSLVMEPAVLLLDESLAALDVKLRKIMQDELRQLHSAIGGTFVFVTHDQGEAMAMANRVAVMKDGCLVQQGSPEEIYQNPTTEFVAGFVGDANILPGERSHGRVLLDCGISFEASGPDGRVAVVVRPNEVRVVCAEAEAARLETTVRARITGWVFMGPHIRVAFVLCDGTQLCAHLPSDAAITSSLLTSGEVLVGWEARSRRVVRGDS